jgi:hypothetical protein
MWHVCVRGEVDTVFWWKGLRETVHLCDPAVDERILLILIVNKWDGEAWSRMIWHRIGRDGNRL